MSETNQIINALLRLQRAGAEDSKATAKLKAAAGMVGRAICDSLPEEALQEMERHAVAGIGTGGEWHMDGVSRKWQLQLCHCSEDMIGLVNADRDAALTFARYVAVGWLDELAHWLEERAVEAEKAAQVLEEKAAVKGEAQE